MTKKRSLSPNHFIFIPKILKNKTYILSRKIYKQSERKYLMIKILIFIKIIFNRKYEESRLKKIFLTTKHIKKCGWMNGNHIKKNSIQTTLIKT